LIVFYILKEKQEGRFISNKKKKKEIRSRESHLKTE